MNYASIAFGEASKKLQERNGSRKAYALREKQYDVAGLSMREIELITSRDSFYAASVGENGYPYIQHRGGPIGFLKVIDYTTLGFLDFSGNKQYITIGNLELNNKVALILMDYPTRTRLKIYARAEVIELGDRPDIEAKLDLGDYKQTSERVILYHIDGFDWNCPQHITPRFTKDQVEQVIGQKDAEIARLEAEVKRLKDD